MLHQQCQVCIRHPFLINAPCLIDTPRESYSKIQGITGSIKEQNHSIYLVSCFINKGLPIAVFPLSSSQLE